MADQYGESLLAVDFGSVWTRAVLIDAVDGTYRLVARAESRTTDGFPTFDMAVGFDRVVRQLASVTRRRLAADSGQLILPQQSDGSGVDQFLLTASIGRPMRAVVVGLVPEVSIDSAVRAAAGTYIEITAALSLDDGLDEEQRLNLIQSSFPDVIFIAGGTEQGADRTVLRLAETVQLAIGLMAEYSRPVVVFAGNSALVDAMQSLFEGIAVLLIAENVRPSLEVERLDSVRLQLARAFDRYKERRDNSLALVSAMSNTGLLPSAQGHVLMADYLGRIRSGGVALVDFGSATSSLVISYGDRPVSSIRTDLGLGHSAPYLLESIGLDAVRRWLPFEASDSELINYTFNKSVRPATIPVTLRELYIEHAMLRAGVRAMITGANLDWAGQPLPLATIIGAGSALTRTGHPAHDALLMLDALQPTGVTELKTDPFGLIPAMGAIAWQQPEVVVQLMESDNLNMLGTCINVEGAIRPDKTALTARIMRDNGHVDEINIPGGYLYVYPLPLSSTARLEIRCAGRANVGGKRRLKLKAEGGLAGLIFDTRGRPLPLGLDSSARAQQMPYWIAAVTGDPPNLLVEEMPDLLEVPVDRPEKSGKRGRGKDKRDGKRKKGDKKQKAAAAPDQNDLSDLDELLGEDDAQDDDLKALRDVLS